MCIICMDSEQHVHKTYLQLVAMEYVISFIFVHHGFFHVLIMIINYVFIIIIIINLTHIKLEPPWKSQTRAFIFGSVTVCHYSATSP